MRIVTNQKKVNLNKKIGQYTSIGSLVVLVGGFVLSFKAETMNLSFLALVIGLLLSQVGIYYANRWGRSPRIDERLSLGLKGLDDKYTLYHYSGPVPHLLVGPAGIWVLTPMYQSGKISFEKKRLQQRGIGFFQRFFFQESLGRPDLEAQTYLEDMQKYLQKSFPNQETSPVQGAIVFTSPKAEVNAPEAPVATMHVDKLKDFIRRMAKEQPASMNKVNEVIKALPQPEE